MAEFKPQPKPFPRPIPFVEALGFELLGMAGGEAEILLELQPEHANSHQVAHGGIVMTLLDVAMAHAARSFHTDAGEADHGVLTIEMKTSFFSPGQGTLRAVGKVLHRTSSLAFCEGAVYADGAAQPCAHATATFKYLRTKAPTGVTPP